MERSGKFYFAARRLFVCLFVIGIGVPMQRTHAQPTLNFNSVVVNWPTIELYFSASCDGQLDLKMSAQDLRVFENNVPISNFQLWCPDVSARSSFSVALVFDASGSMVGTGNAAAKQAGHAFIDLMDGVVDEATIVWFTSVVTVYQQMTTNKPMLHSAVDALPASGATAVWDGGYAGLIELINNGVNQVRAVILMTDGGDNSSSRTPAEIIALANRHRIRVFTLGLGYTVNNVELEMIAQLTGGEYYHVVNAGELAGVYVEISTLLAQQFQECLLTYEAQCADGGLRNVELQLRDYCNGSDTQTKTWRAPLDSSTMTPLQFDLGENIAKHGENFTLPLNLRSSIPGNNFYPLHFTLAYDTSVLQFTSVTAPPGSMLDGVPITATPVAGGVRIESTAPVVVSGYGRVMNLTFSTQPRTDTLCRDIRAVNAGFSQGCYIALIDTGRVCLYPTVPVLSCSVTAPPKLEWRQDLKGYQQNPFTIAARFDNTGDATVRTARYRILYDPNDLELLSPTTDTQTPSPSHIDPGMFATVGWQVAVKPQTSDDTIEVCILGSFDNHPDVTCCVQIAVSKAGTALSCTAQVPDITADTAAVRYQPMPIPLQVTARNTGGSQSDTVWVSLALPPEFTLAPPGIPISTTKSLQPALLVPGQSGSVNWLLLHPIISSERNYTITVTSWSANQDTTSCSVDLRIPGLPSPSFSTQLTASGPLVICEGDSVTLDAGSGYLSYNWSTGQQTRQISVNYAGSFFCVVRRADGLVGRSDTLQVGVRPAPKPSIIPGGTLWFCVGDSIVLGVDGSYEEYLWNIGATTPELVVRIEGKYFVRVRDSHGCWGQSDPVTVISFLKPDKPVIRRTGDVLSVPEGYRCQWFRNGVEIPGAIQPALVVTQPGSYQVRVTSSRGCSVVSDIFDVTVLGVSDHPPLAGAPTLQAWPEPASDVLRIRITDIDAQPFTLYLFDVLGRADIIRTSRDASDTGEFLYSLSGREAGVYYLVAVLPETVLVKRVTKM